MGSLGEVLRKNLFDFPARSNNFVTNKPKHWK